MKERTDCEEVRPKPKEKWMEWCVEANKYRCMRCGRGNKYMKMPEKWTGLQYLSIFFLKNVESVNWSHDLVRRMERQGEVLIWCRKCSDYARQRM